MNKAQKYVDYCKRDTEITGKFVKQMLEKYEEIGCIPKTTIAATTLNYFESQFYKKITHAFTEEQIDFFHQGYYGGRTEIFHNSPIKGPIFYHDINSLYPSVMRDNPFPHLDHFYETKTPDLHFEGMADVDIKAPEALAIPYLPHKYEGKLIFPLGEWRGVYTYFELREAHKLGYRIKRCYRAVEFPSSFNPFREFIETIYSKRLEAQNQKDELMSMVFKAFGNFAYGKYAQGNETTELVPLSRLKEIPDGSIILDGSLVLIHRKKKYPRYANCIWANYVTAYSRHSVYFDGFTPCLRGGGRILYCDTDSVMYTASEMVLEHSKELGKFKLEGIYEEAYYKLPKLYYLNPYSNRSKWGIKYTEITGKKQLKSHIYKSKGIPKSASKRFFRKNKARFKKPNKLRESLRRNLSKKNINKLLIPNYWETREKEISGKYTKRRVLKDGSTLPLILIPFERGKTNGKENKRHRLGSKKTRDRGISRIRRNRDNDGVYAVR